MRVSAQTVVAKEVAKIIRIVRIGCENPAIPLRGKGLGPSEEKHSPQRSQRDTEEIRYKVSSYQEIEIVSSARRLSDSSVPVSSKALVMAAFPFSTAVITYEQPIQWASS